MPFQSVKQKGYLLAHPEITDKKGRSVGRKWAKKYGAKVEKKHDWAKALAVGTVAGGLANQFPRIQDIERAKKRKKGRVRKAYEPVVTDPDFNQQAAERAFNLVMKMDDDTAEVFTSIVVADYFEETVEKNLGTLQRHLNEVIAKQLADVKRAHLRLVSKGMDSEQSVAYAQALALIEKSLVSKVGASQRYGYQWEEKDFLRDPSSGRFRTKITHNQTTKIRNKTFKSIAGQDTPKEINGKSLSYEDQVRFQDEYRQLAGFLEAVNASSGSKGDQTVMLHYRDRNGQPFSRLHFGSKPPVADLADPDFRLMGAEAKPEALTAGGAAFGLATALGGGMNAAQVKAINNIEGGAGRDFTRSWLGAGEDKNSNAKLYGRLAASGSFLQDSRLGPKAELAGKFASIVGSAGPQAEAVLGPTARKTAYRYRGTEKTPERAMVRAYAQRVEQGKVYGEAPAEPGYGVREARRQPKAGEAPSLQQMVRDRAEATGRAPTWRERELGRQALVDHLRQKMPQKNLYELQLASGSTPPSEGVIINADGQLVTQAIGYGDDHYLPFNLKNLKGLKGGEYIRTRSVGGLTSEDIYTALMMGARQVTVTSRSGTYTMEFEPDFRGGRRHNDKARRMTRRYEQLLDAVQSQQVDRIDIDPEMREEIEREVKEEMSGPGWTRRDQMEAVRERVDDFKMNPYITEKDEKRAEAIISARSANASEGERAKIRAQVMDDLMDQKEVKFRLNSAGYKAALDALQEQFPYYIAKPRWTPPKDEGKKIDIEQDRGYVEPGRNRPTAAAAGLFGARNRSKYSGQGGKYSASEANYQGARGTLVPRPAEAAAETPASKPGAADVHAQRAEKAAIQAMEYKASEVAAQIQSSAKRTLDPIPEEHAEALEYTADDLKDATKQARFKRFADVYLNSNEVRNAIGASTQDKMRREWESAIGFRDRKPFSRESAGIWPKQTPTFEGGPYKLGADRAKVLKELDRVDKYGVVNGIPLSHLSEREMEAEHRTLLAMREMLSDSPGIALTPTDLEKYNVDLQSPGLAGGLLRDPEKITDRMEALQRVRVLMSNLPDEAREARMSGSPAETKQVVHNTPGPADKTLQAQAAQQASEITMVRMALEREDDKDEVEIKRLRDLADSLAATAPQLSEPEMLEQFKAEHRQDFEVFNAARDRLRNPPPRKPS